MRDRPRGSLSPDLPRWLAYATKPVLPILGRTRLVRAGLRTHNPGDILLPKGYRAEVVAIGFNAPVHICFDGEGRAYVSEAGHKSYSRPRILSVDVATGAVDTFLDLPEERWIETGALTGACWHDGWLYFTNTDTVSRYRPGSQIEDIVTGLPGRGDHQTNHPLVGTDRKIYFGVGSATNSGVVGPDNLAYGWLDKFPADHDVPAHDITLSGRNFESRNVLGSLRETVRTGAFVPYGTATEPGWVVPGSAKCHGILRCNPDGSELEVVAWGLRNPYGLAFHPDGRLFATEHGMDARNRHVVGDPDDFYEIVDGTWYGFPDFASGIRLDDPYWGDAGIGRQPVLAEFPDPHPPAPYVSFQGHAGSNGVAFSSSAGFGFEGDAFVCLFGDLAPVTTPRLHSPSGFKVVRVDMKARKIVDFAVNKIAGPASKLPHGGFERPSHCAFGPDGALYVVDWGEIKIAPEAGGVRMKQGTGTLWRIVRTDGPRGEAPPEPLVVPLYGIQVVAAGALGLAAVVAIRALLARRRRGRERRRGLQVRRR
jgi:glucose/arabinose dehydrogenase